MAIHNWNIYSNQCRRSIWTGTLYLSASDLKQARGLDAEAPIPTDATIHLQIKTLESVVSMIYIDQPTCNSHS